MLQLRCHSGTSHVMAQHMPYNMSIGEVSCDNSRKLKVWSCPLHCLGTLEGLPFCAGLLCNGVQSGHRVPGRL